MKLNGLNHGQRQILKVNDLVESYYKVNTYFYIKIVLKKVQYYPLLNRSFFILFVVLIRYANS